MNKNKMDLAQSLLPMPLKPYQVVVGEVYLHIPEYDASLREQDDFWFFRLLPDGNDLKLEHIATKAGIITHEEVLSFADLKALLDAGRKNGSPSKDTLAYRTISDAILMRRENFAKNILSKHNLVDSYAEGAWRKRDIPLDLKNYPVFFSDNDSSWQLKIYSEDTRDLFSSYKNSTPTLLKVDWNDEAMILKAIDLLLDNSRWSELEAQEALLS